MITTCSTPAKFSSIQLTASPVLTPPRWCAVMQVGLPASYVYERFPACRSPVQSGTITTDQSLNADESLSTPFLKRPETEVACLIETGTVGASSAGSSIASIAMLRIFGSPHVFASQHIPPAIKNSITFFTSGRLLTRKENSRFPCPHTAGLPGFSSWNAVEPAGMASSGSIPGVHAYSPVSRVQVAGIAVHGTSCWTSSGS
mmetsp:Transcript_45786/g.109222  ORF Transcript_45786/g.109222 Transcript_45786/m.109222 type:complete len:202 (-) Transcript_45786:220-825(-)